MRLQLLAQLPRGGERRGAHRTSSGTSARRSNACGTCSSSCARSHSSATGSPWPLQLYLDHTRARPGGKARCATPCHEEPDSELRALLYRIAQEAVTNAKQARGGALDRDRARDGRGEGISIRVVDDGVGFTPDDVTTPKPGHLGLSTIVERAELAGGWARVTSAMGSGTTIECWLPVDLRRTTRRLMPTRARRPLLDR